MSDDPDVNVIAPDEAAVVFDASGNPRFLVPHELTTDGMRGQEEEQMPIQGMWLMRVSCMLIHPEIVQLIDQTMRADLDSIPDGDHLPRVERNNVPRK